MNKLWWFLRGVSKNEYREICHRCGNTGQAHFSVRPDGYFCWRFKK